MPSIRYLGPTTEGIDVLTRLRLQEEVSGTLTSEQIQSEVLESLKNKADSFYLGSASSQRVSQSAISGKGSTLIRKSTAGQANGPVALSGGRIPGTSYLPNAYPDRPGGRGWRRAAEFNNTNLTLTTGHYASTNLQQIGSFNVPGPSFSWLPIFVGDFTIGFGKGEILIMRGGRPIARAIGGNDPNVWFTCTVVPVEPVALTGTGTFTVHRKAVFSPGETNIGGGFRLTCLAVPA